jgi:hypothetical protein
MMLSDPGEVFPVWRVTYCASYRDPGYCPLRFIALAWLVGVRSPCLAAFRGRRHQPAAVVAGRPLGILATEWL